MEMEPQFNILPSFKRNISVNTCWTTLYKDCAVVRAFIFSSLSIQVCFFLPVLLKIISKLTE